MTQTKTSTELLTDMLLKHRWNSTYQGASIAKVLALLAEDKFFDQIEGEMLNDYNRGFKQAYLDWCKTTSGIKCSKTMLREVLNILRNNGYEALVNNFSILEKHGMPTKIREWCYCCVKPATPDTIIKEIHEISTFSIIETKDNRFRVGNEVHETLDEALICALAHKYDGINTDAHLYIYKMLSI